MAEKDSGRSAVELRQRLTVALATPAVLIVAIGVILYLQITRTQEDSYWLEHSDVVLSKLNQLQRELSDQESSARGYIITQEREFLAPYEAAHPRATIDEIRSLTIDNPPQTQRIDEVRKTYDTWANSFDVYQLGKAFKLDDVRWRKGQMDAVRARLRDMADVESNLRWQRSTASKASSQTTRYAFIILLGLAGASIAFISRRQLLAVAQTFTSALEVERESREAVEAEAWIRNEQAKLGDSMGGELSLQAATSRIAEGLARAAGAQIGVVFTRDGDTWIRRASHGIDMGDAGPERFKSGEGLIGAAGLSAELSLLSTKAIDAEQVPAIRSAIVDEKPRHIVLVPAPVEGRARAVIELGFVLPPSQRAVDYLKRIGESVGVAVQSAEYKERLRDLLEESRRQAEMLQSQQEELRVANEELHERSNALVEAQQRLEEQQHELETTNARLEEQRNDLVRSQTEVVQKAQEVERASRYKSEFLANMSHELRTPLNSTLILAKLLGDNAPGNLTEEQVKFAQTIYGAGNDLLTLINDVLDLSKIEAGKIDVRVSTVPVERLKEVLTRMFEPMARDKSVVFRTTIGPDVPSTFDSDSQRVEQILKNLLSNAVKFTESGSVTLDVGVDDDGMLTFAVRDTGIGIPSDAQNMVFEAFRQVDGAASRKHNGTGLGLSISRDLARVLGGSITLESTVGQGSTFTLRLPRVYVPVANSGSSEPAPVSALPARRMGTPRPFQRPANPQRAEPVAINAPLIDDDRERLDGKHRVVLAIEDDVRFAEILVNVARELDFHAIVAHTALDGWALVKKYKPSAVLLDMNLPDHSGLSVLDRMKRDSTTRHIPVHVISVADYQQEALAMGAIGYALKPVERSNLVTAFKKLEERASRSTRRLLIVEDDDVQRDSLTKLLGSEGVEVIAVGTVAEALQALRGAPIDCVVVDLTLPDMSGFELLEQMANDDGYAFPPVIVYTGRSLSAAEEQRLRKFSSSIIVKGARSPERLVDEVTLFLHQVEADMPADRQRMLRQARAREAVFENHTILVVEDDVRNIFALTSVLEPKGAQIVVARNGKEALSMLASNEKISLVLMDVMMPEMDGITAVQEVRKNPKWAKLPVIALTAKAMKDDQERCLKAGFSDFASKPIDVEMLLSLIRIWMPK